MIFSQNEYLAKKDMKNTLYNWGQTLECPSIITHVTQPSKVQHVFFFHIFFLLLFIMHLQITNNTEHKCSVLQTEDLMLSSDVF